MFSAYYKGKEGNLYDDCEDFKNGRSQAIRLPKECRFSSDEVVVNKIGDVVILLPKENKWDSFMRAIDMFSDDFMADGRARDSVQERDGL